MKKTVLMSAAKKARIALAVLAVCGFTFAGAQSAFAENVTIDSNKNIICGDGAKAEGYYVPINAIAIGTSAKVEDFHGIAIGYTSKAIGYHSIAFGDSAETGNYESIAIGVSSKNSGYGSISVGAHSKASGEKSVALGAYSVADEENTVSVGGMYKAYVGVDTLTGAAIYENKLLTRKIVNVADGTKDTDAATVGQIITNIKKNGNTLEFYTGKGTDGNGTKKWEFDLAAGGASFDGTKLNTDIQNVDVAGGYKETTANANAETKGTIAGAINSAYQAGKDYTDTKVSVVEGKLDTLNTKVDTNTTDISNIKSDIGNIKTNIGDMTKLDVNGKNNLVDAVNEAYKAATSAGANVGNLGDLTTTNKDNVVGAVNEVNKKANTAQATATDALNKANTAQTTATDALNKANTAQTTADNALNKANNAQTTADNALDKANTNATNIGNLGELNTTNKGNLVGAVNEVNGKTKENAKAIEKVNGRVDELGGRVSKLDSKVNKVGAGAAALAALHPMEFDSDNKLTFAAGVGSYHGASAAAIGAFYRPSEQVMFSIAGNMGNGENMVNAGVSFALDRPSKTPTTKAMMAKKLAEQEQMLAEQSREIAELKAIVQQLAAKQSA